MTVAFLLDEGLDWLETLSSKGMILLKDRNYPRKNIQDFLSDLTKTGYIEKKIHQGKPVFRLTSQGKIKIARDIPIANLARQKWDGLFRAAAFDVPEEKRNLRDLVREHLKGLGFGMLQKSLWITPYPLTKVLEEFVKFHHLDDYVLIMESKYISVENARELAFRVWKLDKIIEAHLEFIDKWEENLSNVQAIKQSAGEWREEYFELLAGDPLLPSELLPQPWIGEKTKKLFFMLEKLS
ncbi:hypothetical protein HY946_03145 [Candidatus Gottesmanbacteria bacterium]|nr:hypothetical protein [Candidatus Gottesmanbacteria bacterium]